MMRVRSPRSTRSAPTIGRSADEIDVVVRTVGQPGRAAPALREIVHWLVPISPW